MWKSNSLCITLSSYPVFKRSVIRLALHTKHKGSSNGPICQTIMPDTALSQRGKKNPFPTLKRKQNQIRRRTSLWVGMSTWVINPGFYVLHANKAGARQGVLAPRWYTRTLNHLPSDLQPTQPMYCK